MTLFLQQNLFSHDAAHKNVCRIPNSEARKFMYGFKNKVSNKARYNLSIFLAIGFKSFISFMFSVQLICAIIFAYAKIQFSHNAKVGFESV